MERAIPALEMAAGELEHCVGGRDVAAYRDDVLLGYVADGFVADAGCSG